MKKIFISLVLLFALTVGVTANISTKRLEWYFKPSAKGERPSAPTEAHFISEYDTHYIGPDEKKVYLTFDLGYENENVKSILDTLHAENVKATFFLLRHTVVGGKNLDRIIADGHLCANHTLHHKDMTKMQESESFKAELEGLASDYKEVTGKELAKIYRPPCGAFSEQSLAWAKELGYKTVFWSLAYADWDEKHQMSPEAAMNKLMSRMHNGAVILLHPTSSTNAKIMPELIKRLKAEGYEFGTVDELHNA